MTYYLPLENRSLLSTVGRGPKYITMRQILVPLWIIIVGDQNVLSPGSLVPLCITTVGDINALITTSKVLFPCE